MKRSSEFSFCAALVLVVTATYSTTAASADELIRFSRDVRPLLSDRCFTCHGPDRVTREADLRLDRRDGVYEDRDGTRMVVPGKPEESELFRRITAHDSDEKMPPADSGESLSDEEIDVIKRWIEQGAEWEKHWAFMTPSRPEIPELPTSEWVRNPIDAFVLARLNSEQVNPSPEADKRTLIRRVTQDLTGLPPTPEEITHFLEDDKAGAFERVVDRLLDSSGYGEKMALPWLEAARYADTSGYTEDYGRFMYPWRTWVINAFNSNKPFDEFVIEQMAGDLLPNATHEQILATGFNRNHRINQEVGALSEEFSVEYAVDRVETVGTVFLATTIGCARCHDHKYDPLTQKEFYQFYAFLNNNDDIGIDHGSRFGFAKPFIEHPTSQQKAELNRLTAKLAALKAQTTPSAEELSAFEAWRNSFDASKSLGMSNWYSLGPYDHVEQTRTTGFAKPFFAEPKVDMDEVVEGQKWTEQPGWGGQPMMVAGGEYSTIYLFREIYASEAGNVTFGIGASDSIRLWLNGEVIIDRLEAGTNDAAPDPHVLTLKAGRNELLVKMSNGDFAQQISFDTDERILFPDAVFAILGETPDSRSADDKESLYAYFHKTRQQAVQQDINVVSGQVARVMVMQERENVRPARILERGSYAAPGEKVDRDVPSVLPPLPEDAPRDRLGLAQWLVSDDQPLTARVTVNRFWQNYFGNGLVKTSEDFGAQGEYPSHPDLLDWLATEFMSSGWDVKKLQKLIVTSATYRQSSAAGPEQRKRDPENRLLARGTRFRLRPQEIRDQALFASGLLVERVGGPSVKPYQPAGLWEEVANLNLDRKWFLTDIFHQDHGDKLYRRSLYTFWKRSVPPPNMSVFDAETREVCVVVRQNSNTPLQAMNLLNDVTYVEAARHLAHRILTEGGLTDEDQLAFGMELVTGRRPTDQEQQVLQQGLAAQRDDYQRDPEAAATLLAAGESGVPGNHDPVVHAAWTQIALLLFNLDESITRQ